MDDVYLEIRELLDAMDSETVSVQEFQRRLQVLFYDCPAAVDRDAERDIERWFNNVINDLELVLYTQGVGGQICEAKRIAKAVRQKLDTLV